MQRTREIPCETKYFVHTLLQTVYRGNQNAVTPFLSSEIYADSRDFSLPASVTPTDFFSFPQTWLHRIDSTWLADWFALKLIPTDSYPLFLSLCSRQQQKELQEMLSLSSPPPSLPKWILPFLLHTLMRHSVSTLFPSSDIPPLFLFTSHRLFPLLSLSKEKIIQWIDMLPIYELSVVWIYSLDAQWKRILLAQLSPLQKKLLFSYIQKRKASPLQKQAQLHLREKWKEKKMVQKNSIHLCGISLLHSLLQTKEQHTPSIAWYLARILDKKRGSSLEKELLSENVKPSLLPKKEALSLISHIHSANL